MFYSILFCIISFILGWKCSKVFKKKMSNETIIQRYYELEGKYNILYKDFITLSATALSETLNGLITISGEDLTYSVKVNQDGNFIVKLSDNENTVEMDINRARMNFAESFEESLETLKSLRKD